MTPAEMSVRLAALVDDMTDTLTRVRLEVAALILELEPEPEPEPAAERAL